MRRFIFITQVVDPEHPALGATVAKIRALARRVDEVVVLTLAATPGSLPSNCRVRTVGGATRLERGVRFESALAAELRPRPVAVLAHMSPIYAALAAPLCRPLRVPLLLWYTQWHKSRVLVVAERVSNAVVTVDVRSFPLPSAKVVATGHGIDLDEFPCVERSGDRGLHLLSLGRYSQAKGIDTVLRAIAMVPDAILTHHGPALTPEELRCRSELDQLVEMLGVSSRVSLHGPVPRSQVPELLAGADALVNNMRLGAPDKVVYEAAATCLPVFASNPIFDDLLPEPLRFSRRDVEALAERLRGFRSLDRRLIGHQLRERVAQEHSVDGWAERVLQVVE
jgi:glycosyltransferase involved in cell wall biosynthesis